MSYKMFPCGHKPYFYFCSFYWALLVGDLPVPATPTSDSLKKGSVWRNWCVLSHLRQLLWENTLNDLTPGLLLAWHMTSEKFQCCDSFASGKPQLLCPDHLRLVGQHHAWEEQQPATDDKLLVMESHTSRLLPWVVRQNFRAQTDKPVSD